MVRLWDFLSPRLALDLHYNGTCLRMGGRKGRVLMTFAEKLKELRQARGLTQPALAAATGIPVATIRDYEQGKRDPLFSNAQKLARGLGVSLDVFPSPAEPGLKARKAAPAPKRPRGRRKGE